MLVFCKDKEDLQHMIPEVSNWLGQAGFETETFEIHNGLSNRENEKTLRRFRRETGKLHVLFSINMLIEGLHVEGVDLSLIHIWKRRVCGRVFPPYLSACLSVRPAMGNRARRGGREYRDHGR